MIEDWVFFGLGASAASAGVMLVQEWMKASGFAVAFWNKIACILIMIPFVVHLGLPDNPYFYLLLCGQAFLWMISDVIFFNAIPKVGAGVVSRLLPGSVILTFILWFVFDPGLLARYMEKPGLFAMIFGVICLSAYFAMRLKRCPVSWEGLRLLWFVFFASVAGPIAVKLVTQQVDIERGPYAMVFVEGLIMVFFWMVYYAIRRPIPWAILTGFHAIKAGFMVGICSSTMVILNLYAMFGVDNPAYLTAVKFLDSVMIALLYLALRRKDDSDIVAGFGVVGCAAGLVLLKSFM
jgi:hypothetical protein